MQDLLFHWTVPIFQRTAQVEKCVHWLLWMISDNDVYCQHNMDCFAPTTSLKSNGFFICQTSGLGDVFFIKPLPPLGYERKIPESFWLTLVWSERPMICSGFYFRQWTSMVKILQRRKMQFFVILPTSLAGQGSILTQSMTSYVSRTWSFLSMFFGGYVSGGIWEQGFLRCSLLSSTSRWKER